jgi:hypothetical protein
MCGRAVSASAGFGDGASRRSALEEVRADLEAVCAGQLVGFAERTGFRFGEAYGFCFAFFDRSFQIFEDRFVLRSAAARRESLQFFQLEFQQRQGDGCEDFFFPRLGFRGGGIFFDVLEEVGLFFFFDLRADGVAPLDQPGLAQRLSGGGAPTPIPIAATATGGEQE